MRRLLGLLFLILFLAGYVVGAVELAALPVLQKKFLQALFFVAAGILWVFPAIVILRIFWRPEPRDRR